MPQAGRGHQAAGPSALPRKTLEALPDNYAAAIRSRRFTADHPFDPSPDYLPSGLLADPGEWVELDPWPGTLADQREGRLTLHVASFRARSVLVVACRDLGPMLMAETVL